MSTREDIDLEIAEEDETRRLLTKGDAALVAPAFDFAAAQSGRPRLVSPLLYVALIALLLVVTSSLIARRGDVLASPAPSVIATGQPTARQPTDRRGLLVRASDARVDALTEHDWSIVASFDATGDLIAISANGRDVAYWRAPDARELWLAPVRDPGSARRLMTLTGERGVGVAWAPDGSSLMVAVRSATDGPTQTSSYAALRVLQRDGSALRELARIPTSQPVQPLAWDPTRGVAAAVELSPRGPSRYVVVAGADLAHSPNAPAVRVVDLPDAGQAGVIIGQLRASSDARFVMATWNYEGRSVIQWWPVDGPDTGRIGQLLPKSPGETIRGAAWRPNTPEIGVNIAGTFELWALDGRRQSVRELGGSAAAFAFRYDGTAVYSGAMGGGRLVITDLSSPTFTQQEVPAPAGVIVGSVRLDAPP